MVAGPGVFRLRGGPAACVLLLLYDGPLVLIPRGGLNPFHPDMLGNHGKIAVRAVIKCRNERRGGLGIGNEQRLSRWQRVNKGETLCYLGVIESLIVSADRDRDQKTNHGHDND